MYLGQPESEENYTVKWDGEWQITLEVFRDLGMAFYGRNDYNLYANCWMVPKFQNSNCDDGIMIPLSFDRYCFRTLVIRAFFTANIIYWYDCISRCDGSKFSIAH